jgi:branched-chain amino acid transport system substrate-binding protein
MTKTTKIVIGIIIAIIVTVVIILAMNNKNQKTGEIKIGAILPLTGDFSFIGEEARRGIQLAQEEAKVNGFNASILYEDDQSLDPTSGVNAANKLINQDKIQAGLTVLVEEAKPMAPIFNNAKTPLVVMWDSNSFLQSQEYLFGTGFSTEKTGEKMAEYAYNKLGLKKVAIAAHKDAWAEIISKSFSDKFQQLGGSIVYNQTFLPDEKDYRTAITKMKTLNPDGVYFPMLFPTSSNFLMQSKELGFNPVFMTGDAFVQDAISAAGGAAENVYFTNIYTNESADLIQKYKTTFGSDPIDITIVSFGYDAFNAIKNASTKGNTIYDGLLKTIGKNRSLDRIEKIYQVKNGSAQLAE